MADWQVRMTQDMKLRDFRPRTQEAYLLAAKLLERHFGRPPETLTEEDLRAYFLHLREVRKLAPSTLSVAANGLRFLYVHTLGLDWSLFELLRVHKPRTLPVVLSPAEVRTLLGAIQHPVRRVALTTIYALGLRLGEGLALGSGDIDSQRLLVWVRDGKGARDRGIPLPRPLLLRLRRYWKEERPKVDSPLLFVRAKDALAIDDTTLQKTFTAARHQIGLLKDASIHTPPS